MSIYDEFDAALLYAKRKKLQASGGDEASMIDHHLDQIAARGDRAEDVDELLTGKPKSLSPSELADRLEGAGMHHDQTTLDVLRGLERTPQLIELAEHPLSGKMVAWTKYLNTPTEKEMRTEIGLLGGGNGYVAHWTGPGGTHSVSRKGKRFRVIQHGGAGHLEKLRFANDDRSQLEAERLAQSLAFPERS